MIFFSGYWLMIQTPESQNALLRGKKIIIPDVVFDRGQRGRGTWTQREPQADHVARCHSRPLPAVGRGAAENPI